MRPPLVYQLHALPPIIDQLRAHGYRFATVSEALDRPAVSGLHAVSTADAIRAWITAHAHRLRVAFVALLGWLLLPHCAAAVLRTVVVTALALVLVRKEKRRPPAVGTLREPVSGLVPAYCEDASIASTMTSLPSSRAPDFEVMVIDDDSTDQTAEILAEVTRRATGCCAVPTAARRRPP